MHKSPKTDSNNPVKKCYYCSGTGTLVIKNAYDPEYEKLEECPQCGGRGVVPVVGDDYGPN
jgi:DnaJ-class molecular chaperone